MDVYPRLFEISSLWHSEHCTDTNMFPNPPMRDTAKGISHQMVRLVIRHQNPSITNDLHVRHFQGVSDSGRVLPPPRPFTHPFEVFCECEGQAVRTNFWNSNETDTCITPTRKRVCAQRATSTSVFYSCSLALLLSHSLTLSLSHSQSHSLCQRHTHSAQHKHMCHISPCTLCSCFSNKWFAQAHERALSRSAPRSLTVLLCFSLVTDDEHCVVFSEAGLSPWTPTPSCSRGVLSPLTRIRWWCLGCGWCWSSCVGLFLCYICLRVVSYVADGMTVYAPATTLDETTSVFPFK